MINFLKLVIPDTPNLYAVIQKQNGSMLHYKAESIAALAAILRRYTTTSNAFMALASYSDPIPKVDASGAPILDTAGRPKYSRRTKKQVKQLKALWLDLDVGDTKGYGTQREALVALAEFLKVTKLPTPLVTSSGGGLHVYWPFVAPIDVQDWRPIAGRLKAATQVCGLRADPTRTLDEASVLRPVGGLNHKYTPAQPVRVLIDAGEYNPADLERLLDAVPGVEYSPSAPTSCVTPTDFPTGLDKLGTQPPTYASIVANECAIIGEVRDTRGNVLEPVWRGCIGILKHCVDGASVLHDWSNGHAGYSYAETQEKYDTYSAGPTTCSYLSDYEPDKCAACKHRGTCATPLHLGNVRDVVVPSEPQTAPEESPAITEVSVGVDRFLIADATIADAHTETFSLPPGYVYENGGIGRIVATDTGTEVVQISTFAWYPYARVRDEAGEFSYRCRAIKGTTVEEFEIPAKSIATTNSLIECLAKVEIYNMKATAKIRTAITQYAIDYCTGLVKDVQVTRTYRQFGWTPAKDGIVFGNTLVDTSGMHHASLAGNAVSKAPAFVIGDGRGDGWVDAVEYLYNRPNSASMQYALLSGFGSLLGPFISGDAYAGVPCAITSQESGIGKTTVAKLALTAFGDWREMFLSSSAGATRMARVSTISAMGNFPVLLDELTDIDPNELSDLLYNVSNGRDRQRLASDGTLRPVESWNSSVYITANEHLITKLAAMRVDTEANQVRVFEIDPSKYGVPKLDPVQVDMHMDKALKSRGVVGLAFGRELLKDTKRVYETLSQVEKALVRRAPSLNQPKYRFYRYHAVCTIAAGLFLHSLGFIAFDMKAVTAWAAAHIETLVAVVRDNSVDARSGHGLLDELVRDLQGERRLLVTNGYGTGRSRVPVITEPVNILEARMSLPTTASDQKSARDGWIYISNKYIKHWCAQRRLGVEDLFDTIAEVTTVHRSEQVTLSAHTHLQGGRARCVGIDATVLIEQGLELEEFDTASASM